MLDDSFEILKDSDMESGGVAASGMDVCSYHMHTHLYYEMLLYEPFEGYIRINGRELPITKPTAVLIAPGDFHSTVLSGKTSRVLKMQCDSAKPERSYSTAVMDADCHGEMIKQLFYSGVEYRNRKDYLLAVIRMAISEISFHGQIFPDTVTGKTMFVSKTMQYINRNFRGEVTLGEAAETLHVSAPYLSGLFSKTVGIPFQRYVIEKRLSTAASLLGKGNRSVTKACYECGYTNLSHFIRSFEKQYGVSPGEYGKKPCGDGLNS